MIIVEMIFVLIIGFGFEVQQNKWWLASSNIIEIFLPLVYKMLSSVFSFEATFYTPLAKNVIDDFDDSQYLYIAR